MIKKIIQKLENYYEKRIENQFKKNPEKLLEIAESIIDQGGNVRIASDSAWYAVYLREELDNQEGIEEFRERARSCTYSGYDPLKSNIPEIRDLAYNKIKIDKVRTLEKIAAEKFRLGLEDRALDYYLDAFKIAKSFDPELQKEVKENFAKVVEEVRREKYGSYFSILNKK